MPAPRVRDLKTALSLVQTVQETFNDRADGLAKQVWAGELSVTQWRETMRREIKDLHVMTVLITRGGDPNALTQADYGRMGGRIKGQYFYLDKFAKTIQDSADASYLGLENFKSEKYIANRAKLYGPAARGTFWQSVTYGLLPQVPGDGKTRCLTNCGCDLRIESGDTATQMLVYWVVNPALENCEDCLRLAKEWNPLVIDLPYDMVSSGQEIGLDVRATVANVLRADFAEHHKGHPRFRPVKEV